MNATVKARVEPQLKADSESIFQQLGLDMTAAIKMFLSQVVMHGGLPFEAKIVTPNAATIKAIEDSYAGKMERFESVEAMLADADR